MAVTKARKTEQVEKLSRDLKNVSNMVVATYTKMTVAQDYELRKALRGAGAKYKVVKNTLAEKAAKGTKVEGALKDLAGVTSIAYTTGDPVAMAKALTKYAKDTPEFTFKIGVVEGTSHQHKRDRSAGHHAFEGRAVFEAAVPDQCSGAASGDCDERRSARPGGGGRSGRAAEKVQGSLACVGTDAFVRPASESSGLPLVIVQLRNCVIENRPRV